MSTAKVESGVKPFEGVFGTSWYGWASKGDIYKEGGIRHLKLLAKLDARALAKQVGRLP